MHLDAALVAAVCGAAGGWFVPALVGRLPEPARDPDPEKAPEERKEPYADIAALPGLAWKSALVSAACAALVGLAVGREWALVVLVPLVPVSVALAVIDWRTRLLPTRLVLPATGAAILLGLLGWAVTRDPDDLVRAAIALVVVRSVFWVLWWFHSAGMGFGDVRLAAMLGFALGQLGWAEVVVGVYSGFLIFGLPGLLLAIARRDRALLRSPFPFGPFMLAGGLIGILVGSVVWSGLFPAWA
ncbi:A24 family peptidase [Nocardioides sp.]|uniref:A24 family peptidase n=1 Tax=Nocardioides sp. TaxID=35761 RepID=UPI002D809B98|nr:A24 family peptidase [Nocardioides sp.]HET8962207.1 A24 family peptidase [Nocardioides sp.]